MPLTRFFYVLLVLVCCSARVLAEADTCADDRTSCQAIGAWDVSVSMGLGARSNPLVGGDEQLILLVPQISWYGEKFFLQNFEVGYTFVDQSRHMLNAVAGLSFDHIYFDDIGLGNFSLNTGSGLSENGAFSGAQDQTPEFIDNGLSEEREGQAIDINDVSQRKIALLGGLDYSYFSGPLQFNLQALNDLSGVHKGEEFRLSSSYVLAGADSRTSLTLGLAWQSEALLDYYYGLDENEITEGSPAYQMESGLTSFVKMTYERRLSKKWTLLTTVQYRKLPSSLSSSPIVDSTGVSTVFIGGSYHF